MDQLTGMRVFVRTADAGSFAAAAKTLGMSSQMAGRYIEGLEQYLGTQLIVRSTRSQRLTEPGRLYLETARAILAEVDAADHAVRAHAEGPRGKLRISAGLSFGSRLVPELARFLTLYPDITVDLVLDDRRVDVIDDDFDAAIRIGPLPDSGLIARPLTPYRLVLCASPAYLAAHGAPAHPHELADHVAVGYEHANYPAAAPWRFERDGEWFDAPPAARLRVNDPRALVDAALAGVGLTLAGEPIVRHHLDSGRLCAIPWVYRSVEWPMNLIYAGRRAQSVKLRTFIEWLVTIFPPAGPAGS